MNTKKIDEMEKRRKEEYVELQKIGAAHYESIRKMVEGLNSEDDAIREAAQQKIQEDPLEVSVR